MIKMYLLSNDIEYISKIREALTKSVEEQEALISPLIKNTKDDKAYITISIGKENDCNAVIAMDAIEYYMEFYGELENKMLGDFDKHLEDF